MRKVNFPFFSLVRENRSGASPSFRDLWGSAPSLCMRLFMGLCPIPRPLFLKSGGKIMFYRKASRSLRSRNTLRLFTFLKLRFWLLFRCSQIHNPNQDSKSNPHITKNQKFPKNTDVLARSRQGGVTACYTRERAIINNRFILPRKHAHLCGINSTAQIQAIHQIPI